MYSTAARALRVAGAITACGLIMANLQSDPGGAGEPPALLSQQGRFAPSLAEAPPAVEPTERSAPTTELRLVIPTFEVPVRDAPIPPTSAPAPPTTAPPPTPTTTLSAPPITFALPTGPATDEAASDLTHEQRVGADALRLLSYPWQQSLPGWQIHFLPGRPGLLGATWPEDQQIDLYVRAEHSADDVAHVLAHEMGHAIDVTWFGPTDRSTWRAARGFAAERAWFGQAGESDYATPSGDFAEAFAVWQVGSARYRGVAGPALTAEQLALVAQLSAR
jgi:hypothetical protein